MNRLVIVGLELVQVIFREHDVIVGSELKRFDDLIRRNLAVLRASSRLLNATATFRMNQVQRAVALSYGGRVTLQRNNDRAELQQSRPTAAGRNGDGRWKIRDDVRWQVIGRCGRPTRL